MAQIYKMANVRARVMPYHTSRPFAVSFYYALSDKDDDVARGTACGSELGGLLSAFKGLVKGRYTKAVVYDEDGIVIYRLARKGGKIGVLGVFFEWDDWCVRLERERKAKERFKRQIAGPSA